MTAIGVFDSGIGGITVLRALRRRLPAASFVYLGDTARLPYGTKSAATITHYALQASAILAHEAIELLVVACNTASAVALPALKQRFSAIPVMGVIEPGAAAGVAVTRNRRIGVLATEATVRGNAYGRAIAALDPAIEVHQRACALFVALAEEGWTKGAVARAAAERYLDPLLRAAAPPDTLLLGCTHFPVLHDVIADVAGPGVRIVDSAETTAAQVEALVGPGHSGNTAGAVRFLVTDSPERFARVGSLFLGEAIAPAQVSLVDLAKGS